MVIFPDIEKVLVNYYREALLSSGLSVADGATVSTAKADPGLPQPERQVVIVGNYTGWLDDVRKSATATVEVFATTYADASELALLVDALTPGAVGNPIKRAEVVLGPLRVSDESQSERRALTIDLIVKGSNF